MGALTDYLKKRGAYALRIGDNVYDLVVNDAKVFTSLAISTEDVDKTILTLALIPVIERMLNLWYQKVPQSDKHILRKFRCSSANTQTMMNAQTDAEAILLADIALKEYMRFAYAIDRFHTDKQWLETMKGMCNGYN